MTTDVINGVPRELLEQVTIELEHDTDRYMLGRELRKLLATAQPAADEDDEYMPAGIVESIEHSTEIDCVGMARDALAACVSKPAADGDREQFEAAMEPHFISACFEREDDGAYMGRGLQGAWMGWQARASQPQQAVAVTDVSTLKIALAELHKCGVKPGSLPHMVLTNLIDAAHKTGEEE